MLFLGDETMRNRIAALIISAFPFAFSASFAKADILYNYVLNATEGALCR
jgi:hypothetical protein